MVPGIRTTHVFTDDPMKLWGTWKMGI